MLASRSAYFRPRQGIGILIGLPWYQGVVSAHGSQKFAIAAGKSVNTGIAAMHKQVGWNRNYLFEDLSRQNAIALPYLITSCCGYGVCGTLNHEDLTCMVSRTGKIVVLDAHNTV